jgi:hypothetical protein
MIVKSYKRGQKKVITQPREKQYNFLKYWRVVRYYIRAKYEISLMELDMLLYLYDLPYFKKEDFNYYGNTMSWDKNRFYEMKAKGLFQEWRPGGEKLGRSKMFVLTHKGKTICALTYKKLMSEEPISEDPRSNPLFKSDNYNDKIYRKVIEQMNRSRDSDRKDEQPS